MRSVEVFVHGRRAGVLEEITPAKAYRFAYDRGYSGPPVSLTMPVAETAYTYDWFPPFFEGLLPEGYNLEALLRTHKIDREDFWRQLLAVGTDMVGAVTVREIK